MRYCEYEAKQNFSYGSGDGIQFGLHIAMQTVDTDFVPRPFLICTYLKEVNDLQ